MYSGGESRGGATHVRIGLRVGLPATALLLPVCRQQPVAGDKVTSGGSQGQAGEGRPRRDIAAEPKNVSASPPLLHLFACGDDGPHPQETGMG